MGDARGSITVADSPSIRASIAAASMVSEMAAGKTLAEASEISREAIIEALGGLPLSKLHGAVLAADALQAALRSAR